MSSVLKFPKKRRAKVTKRSEPAEIINAPIITRLNLDPQRVIAGTLEAGLTEVAIIGFTSDGEFYFAGSNASGPDTLWLLEVARVKLMKAGGIE